MKKGKIVASIEARMGSGRLPGKVLLTCAGQPMLARLIERVRRSKVLDEIVIATSINPGDDVIENCAHQSGVHCYRGSENDVSGRVLAAMQMAEADVVVQLTGDNPLVDPGLIDQLTRIYLHNQEQLDFVVNTRLQTFPEGLEIQVLSLATLARSHAMAVDDSHREHVCLAIHENPDLFRIFNLTAPAPLCRPDIRLTLDEPGDYQLISRIFEALLPEKPTFSTLDVLALLEANPEWLQLNRAVQNKVVRS